jgi:hypothetical protein
VPNQQKIAGIHSKIGTHSGGQHLAAFQGLLFLLLLAIFDQLIRLFKT